MITDEQSSPRSTKNTKRQRPTRPPSWASLRRFPEVVTFAEISHIAQYEALLVGGSETNPLVLMPAADYDQMTQRVALLRAMVISSGEKIRAAEPSNPDPVFQEEAEYWLALEQMNHLDRQAQEWERTNGNESRALAVFTKACQVFEHVGPAIDWLNRPNALLAGMKPSRLMATDAGVQRVLSALGKIEHGIPV